MKYGTLLGLCMILILTLTACTAPPAHHPGDGHDHSDDEHGDHEDDHDDHAEDHHEGEGSHEAGEESHEEHGFIDVPDHSVVPEIKINVLEDPKSGYNVHITTKRFTFSPASASKEHVLGEGHGHIYVDGKKLNRVYNEWYHLGKLEPGKRVIKVNLNANNHDMYVHDGFPVEASRTITVPEPEEEHGHHAHGDEMVEVSGDDVPSVSLEVLEDPKSGYNVHITTENFKFAPESASKEHVDGEGHAHVYVGDKKINRMYGDWYHLGKLSSGEHTIRVDLNTNDHKPYAVNGEAVEDSVTITVP